MGTMSPGARQGGRKIEGKKREEKGRKKEKREKGRRKEEKGRKNCRAVANWGGLGGGAPAPLSARPQVAPWGAPPPSLLLVLAVSLK